MIDAYIHCGMSKYEPVETVQSIMVHAGVERAVLCQHLDEYDNQYLESIVRAHPSTFAAVGLVDSTNPDWARCVDTLGLSGAFRGIRLTSQMLKANRLLAARASQLGLIPVIYTPNGVVEAMGAITELATSFPGRRIVLTHLGSPVVRGGEIVAGWELIGLAELPGVMVTLSGLGMFSTYPYEALLPLVRETIRAFGADRVMWGSNYPVSGGMEAYRRDLALLSGPDWGLSVEEIHWITEGAAADTFFGSSAVSPEGDRARMK